VAGGLVDDSPSRSREQSFKSVLGRIELLALLDAEHLPCTVHLHRRHHPVIYNHEQRVDVLLSARVLNI
jgi:hypothetical protein